MTQWASRSAFSVLLLSIATFFLIATLPLNPLARLVPLVVVVPTWVLLLVQARLDWQSRGKSVTAEKTLFTSLDEYRKRVSGRSSDGNTGIAIVWLLAMFGAAYVFGLLPAAPIYAFFYVKVREKRGWAVALTVAAGVSILSYVLLVVLAEGNPSWTGILG